MRAAHRWGDRFEMHAERVYTGVIHAGEPGVIVGWFALALDRQIDGGFDGSGAFDENGGASVVARWGAGSKNHVLDAIQFDRGFGDGGELGGALALDRPAGGEGLADGAELAGFGSALIADAGLQHCSGQHVAPVQDSDFRIRDAVLGGQVVEAGALREADRFRDRCHSGQCGCCHCGRAPRRHRDFRRPALYGPEP